MLSQMAANLNVFFKIMFCLIQEVFSQKSFIVMCKFKRNSEKN